jgi:hypothetical protein
MAKHVPRAAISATFGSCSVPAVTPTNSPDVRIQSNSGKRATLLLPGLALVLRLAVFPFAKNIWGDAVARTWLAFDWAAHPHVPTAFTDGVMQFGPLHIVLMGLLGTVWPEAPVCGRALSLVVGVASVVPLMALARRYFGERAAIVAAGVFSLWGLHVQCSTTSASEALCLFLVLAAIERIEAGLASGRVGAFALAGLATTFACATRYNLWLWAPCFALRVAFGTRRMKPTLVFAAVAASFPLLWMVGNWRATGDPLYPLHDIEAFHRAWYVSEATSWTAAKMQWLTLFFWPGLALLSLSPLAALAGGVGAAVAIRRRHPSWWIVALAAGTLAYYTVRALAFSSFVPLARFAVDELALLCLFVEPGAVALARVGRIGATSGLRVVVASAALWVVGLGAFTTFTSVGLAESFLPISPCSRNLRRLEPVIEELQRLTASGPGLLVVDSDPTGYDDLTLVYESGLPRSRVASFRAPTYEATLATGRPTWIVRFDRGPLPVRSEVGDALEFGERRFVASGKRSGAIQIYEVEAM